MPTKFQLRYHIPIGTAMFSYQAHDALPGRREWERLYAITARPCIWGCVLKSWK